MTLKDVIRKVFLVEIVKGMALTFSRLFTRPVTRRYPKEKRPAEPGFRGLHALVRNPATGDAKCVGCGLCAAVCPSRCINVYTSEGPEHQKVVDGYEIEVLRCVFCALCVEACPYGAIALTPHYEYADYSREALFMTKERLLDNWDRYMGEEGLRYFDSFWNPKEAHFKTPRGQAMFKGRIIGGFSG